LLFEQTTDLVVSRLRQAALIDEIHEQAQLIRMHKRKEPELSPAVVAALKAASQRADARWCLKCGQVLLDDPAEQELDPGDRTCTKEHEAGTPQECIDAFRKARADA
jgi:hypothetical protein